ncbi:MAG TPA: phosphotransferase family protein [Caulobacteraceae bacterium]|jgi:aminoglycoside phosphotransferase (APT) family kinase protein|nr:phosphotransferase family protein [Caulobacteraceae bacterium]
MADLEELTAGLEGLVRRRLGGRGIAGLARVSAGATQEIWRFHMVDDGAEVPLILRRAPGGERVSPTAVGLETEAALIEAAADAGVPVPSVRWVLTPDDGLGRGFIMGFVEGETLGGRIARGEAFAHTRAFLARQCGEVLARLHTIDPAGFPGLRRMTPADQVAQYGEIYRATAWPRPVFELALKWLAERCPPPPAAPRLVHGDFRNGNLMIGPEGVRAVLDWEIAHVSDPMEDLGWICVGSWRFGVDDKPVGGFGLREDLWAGYEAAGGAPVRREHALWWEVFGSLRWGIMCSGMASTFRTVDPNVERAVIARRASETEVDLMRLLAA